jgi:hypothetical protein
MTVTMTWHGDAVKRSQRKGAARGLLQAAEHILSKSQPLVPVAPVDGGKLRDSGKASVDESALRAAISYDTDYAVEVHEDFWKWQHAAGTQAKFLEQPFNAERDAVREIIAREIKQDIGA